MAIIVKAYHGFSAIGDNTKDSYEKLLLKKPLLPNLNSEKKKQLKDILNNINQFRIQVPYNDLNTNNRLIFEGPVKIRYAQLILQSLKNHINTRDCHFYACNMDDFSPVGMRNTWRILSNENFDYDEDTYLKGAIKALKHLNPVTPLLNIPNNLLSIIALEHRLKNSNVNFMGENSSSQAFYTAINRTSSNRFKETLILSSMYLHFNFVNYLFYFHHNNYLERLINAPISEYAGGMIFQHVKSVKNDQIEVKSNLSLPSLVTHKSFDLYDLEVQDQLTHYKNTIINEILKAGFLHKDIDLILFQGFHQPLIDLLKNEKVPFFNITPYTGYNLCSGAMALSHYACEFLKNDPKIKTILVIEQGIQGSLWASIFQKH